MTTEVIEDTTTTTATDASQTTAAKTTDATDGKAADTKVVVTTTTAADKGATDKAADKSTTADKPAPKWADTWRDDIVGTLPDDATDEQKDAHDKLSKLVKRYNSPADVAKALRAAQVKLSDGTLKPGKPGANAKPEELAEWRKAHGIPESADKYELKLDDGLVIGDDDRPLVDEFVKAMHGEDATPAQVNKAVSTYLNIRAGQIEKLAEKDAEDKSAVEDDLRVEWGAEYRTNVAGIQSMLKTGGDDVATAIANARGPDGKALLNNPAVVKWLAGHARDAGFVGATVPPAGGDVGKSIADEIAAIEKTMFKEDGTKNADYWKSQKAQDRYAHLLAAQARQQK